MRGKAHGAKQKIKQEKSEQAEGQPSVVEIVALVPGMGSGQDGWNDKADHQAEEHCQKDSGGIELQNAESITVPLGIPEQKLTDKGTERGGKHTDMQIALKIQFFQVQI